MAARQDSYRQFSRNMTFFSIAGALIFLVYLIAAGAGIVWLKVLCAIVAILGSILCLGLLFLTQELLKSRSLWLTTAFAAIVVCTIVSVICNFP